VNCNEDHVSFDVLTSLQQAHSSTPVVSSVVIGVQLNTDGQVPIMYMFSVIWTLSHKTGVCSPEAGAPFIPFLYSKPSWFCSISHNNNNYNNSRNSNHANPIA